MHWRNLVVHTVSCLCISLVSLPHRTSSSHFSSCPSSSVPLRFVPLSHPFSPVPLFTTDESSLVFSPLSLHSSSCSIVSPPSLPHFPLPLGPPSSSVCLYPSRPSCYCPSSLSFFPSISHSLSSEVLPPFISVFLPLLSSRPPVACHPLNKAVHQLFSGRQASLSLEPHPSFN